MIHSLDFMSQFLLIPSENVVTIFDTATWSPVQSLCGHLKDVTFAIFNFLSSRVLTASYDETMRLWDVESGSEVLVIRGKMFMKGAISVDDTSIASYSIDMIISLWSSVTGELLVSIPCIYTSPTSMHFNFEGTRVITLSNTAEYNEWDSSTGKLIKSLPPVVGTLSCTIAVVDSSRFAITTTEGLRVFEFRSKDPIYDVQDPYIVSVQFSFLWM